MYGLHETVKCKQTDIILVSMVTPNRAYTCSRMQQLFNITSLCAMSKKETLRAARALRDKN